VASTLESHKSSRCDRRTGAAVWLVLCLLWLAGPVRATTGPLTLRGLFPDDEIITRSSGTYDLEYVRASAGWVEDVLSRADAARRAVSRAANDAFLVRIGVIVAPDKESFIKMVGGWAEHSAAAARPATRQIVINGEALLRGNAAELSQILVHEFAHIYVGVRCPRPLPRWLDEGIAMHMAGEWTTDDAAALAVARLLRATIPLRELQHAFPLEGNRQRMAYRQAYSVVGFLVAEQFEGSLPALLTALREPPHAEDFIARFWSPDHRQALEARWLASIAGWRSLALLPLHSGLFWGLAGVLTVLAWLVVRQRRRRLRAEWEAEERIYAALDEEERRIWGDDPEADHWDDEEPPDTPPRPRRFHRPRGRF
jgi:hypothetical protein